jgi:hypothetical protein
MLLEAASDFTLAPTSRLQAVWCHRYSPHRLLRNAWVILLRPPRARERQYAPLKTAHNHGLNSTEPPHNLASNRGLKAAVSTVRDWTLVAVLKSE